MSEKNKGENTKINSIPKRYIIEGYQPETELITSPPQGGSGLPTKPPGCANGNNSGDSNADSASGSNDSGDS